MVDATPAFGWGSLEGLLDAFSIKRLQVPARTRRHHELAVSNVPADYFRHFMSSRFGYAAAGSVRVGVARPDLSHHWCRVPS